MTAQSDPARSGQHDLGHAAKMTIDLPADSVLQDGRLIDQVIGQVFDDLSHSSIELRIYTTGAGRAGSGARPQHRCDL